jgi:hypothetical protein
MRAVFRAVSTLNKTERLRDVRALTRSVRAYLCFNPPYTGALGAFHIPRSLDTGPYGPRNLELPAVPPLGWSVVRGDWMESQTTVSRLERCQGIGLSSLYTRVSKRSNKALTLFKRQ